MITHTPQARDRRPIHLSKLFALVKVVYAHNDAALRLPLSTLLCVEPNLLEESPACSKHGILAFFEKNCKKSEIS